MKRGSRMDVMHVASGLCVGLAKNSSAIVVAHGFKRKEP